MLLATLTLTPYQRRYLQPVRDLLFQSAWVHTHLDWHEPDRWLEVQNVPMRLAWQRGQLVGVLACSTPLNGTSWIRMAGVLGSVDRHQVLYSLWDDLTRELRAQGVRTVAALVIRDWLLSHLPEMSFRYVEDIITLARYGIDLPPIHPYRANLRVGETRDLDAMLKIDHAAFAPPWQLSFEELRQAHRIAASCMVALLDERLVGYQLSTLYFDGAHLARLATIPAVQGKGIGGALLADVLGRFFQRGVYSMTLNTQVSNQRSRNLYSRYGFEPNGYDLPYWSANI